MLRRHALPLLLIASAIPLAACSRSEPANSTVLDDIGVTNDALLANDEGLTDGNATFGDNVLLDNEAAPGGVNAS